MTENPPTSGEPEPPASDDGQAPPPPPAEQSAPPPPSGQAPPPPPPSGQASPPPPPPPGQAQPPTYGAPPPAYGAPPPAYGAPPPGYAAAPTLSPSEERTWGGAAHWSALVASLIGLSFLGPLLVLVIQGNKSPFVRRQAVESLNFQISILIYLIVSAILILLVIGILLLIVVGLMWLILTIVGSIKASNGEDYRYPLTIRMIS